MKIFGKVIAVILVCVIAAGALAACKGDKDKEIIGTVNGEVMPEGLFINNFSTVMFDAAQSEETGIDFDLEGEELYNEVKNKQKDGKSYYDIFIDEALEESRKFMIQYQIFSSREGWPSESDIDEIKSTTESYLEQMLIYYGSYIGASNKQELAQLGYGMTYDDLFEYFVLTSTLAQYKGQLQDEITPTDEDLEAFYADNEEDFKTVVVRHSLLLTEDMDDDEKAEVLEHAEELVKKYNDGEITFDDIMKETDDLDNSGKPNSDGYYTVQKDSGFVKNFEDWALARTEASDEIEIVETEFGYHIMICTEIKDLEDEDFRDVIEEAYKEIAVEDQAEEDIKDYLDNSDYEIKNLNRDYVDKIVKRTFTGDFSDVDDNSSETESPATPTAKPEYKDEEADSTVIAKFGDQDVLKAYYVQFFSQGISEALADYDFSDAGETEKEFYEALNKAVLEEYEDGKTYLEYAKERGFELLTSFLATKKMAEEAGETMSDEDIASLLEELDYNIDMMLQYYGTSYGVSTRDDLMKAMMSVNVNDYKNVYIDQTFVSNYANSIIKDMKPDGDALAAYVAEHIEDYRAVTVRRISRSILNSDGEALSDEEQADILAFMELLKTKYENGDSAEALAAGYSQSTDALKSNGLVDLWNTSTTVPQEVLDWAFSETNLGAATIIKTDYSYEFIVIEGFTDNKETKGIVADDSYASAKLIQSELETGFKNDAFDASIQKYIADNGLTLTDINEDVVNDVVTDYLTYTEKD